MKCERCGTEFDERNDVLKNWRECTSVMLGLHILQPIALCANDIAVICREWLIKKLDVDAEKTS